MKKQSNFQDFFPVDNSMKTNNHYDLVTEKFLNGINNYQNKKNNANSISEVFVFSNAIFQIFAGLIIVVFAIIKEIIKLLKQ